MQGYLQRILRARVYDVALVTPLEPAPTLSARLGQRVLLKREDLQPVFSFKLRGAFNKMVQLSQKQREQGVIAASAGNHAQGGGPGGPKTWLQSFDRDAPHNAANKGGSGAKAGC